MILQGDPINLYEKLSRMANIPQPTPVKYQMLGYQMAALAILARQYNRPGARILEIGTGQGASGYMLAKAAPLAKITSLTVSPAECAVATTLWQKSGCSNIACLVETSWNYLARVRNLFEMVFVDGDHNRIERDMPWFNRVSIRGLFLCHDYSPAGSLSASPMVYAALNNLATKLRRPFDVSIIDNGKVGMVGFYRREGETA